MELLLLECRGGSEPSSSLREGPILLKRHSTIALKSPSLAALAAQWERARLPMWETRDAGSVPGSGRSPGERDGNPLQYPCLGNATDRGAWRAAVPGATESRARLSNERDKLHLQDPGAVLSSVSRQAAPEMGTPVQVIC